MIRVSIVIVSYNCEDLISDCVTSCLLIPEAEVIAVDNASTDRTPQILAEFGDRIQFFKKTQNTGFSRGCNIGIDAASGEFIFLLNPDAALYEDTVSSMLAYFTDPEIGAVAPTLVYPDQTFQNYTRRFPSICGLLAESFVPTRWKTRVPCYRRYMCMDVDFGRNQEVEQPAGAAIMFRNKFKLDETYFIYGSDVELCKNIVDAGYRILQVADAKVLHHQSKGGTGGSNPRLKMYLHLDNYYGMQVFFGRYRPFWYLSLYKIIFFFALFIIAIGASLGGWKAFTIKWKRFWYFVQGRDFRSYLQSTGL